MRYNDLIDRIDGFTVGTLIVDGTDVSLKTNTGDEIPLDAAKTIEVLNDDQYILISLNQCRTTLATGTDWPLFAGLYARVSF
jgi:hypothetical protein